MQNSGKMDCDVIALTSFADKIMSEKSMKVGMKEVKNKPVTKKELMRLILMYHFNLTF